MRKSVPDAVIVGAGPAGSTAAFLLASNGLRVVVLDRSHFPREKLCGGLLTWKTIQTLAAAFGVTAATLTSEKIIRHREPRVSRRRPKQPADSRDAGLPLSPGGAQGLRSVLAEAGRLRRRRVQARGAGDFLQPLDRPGRDRRRRDSARKVRAWRGRRCKPRAQRPAAGRQARGPARRRDRHRHRNVCPAHYFRRLPGPPLPALRLYPLGICLVFPRTRTPDPRHPRAEE